MPDSYIVSLFFSFIREHLEFFGFSRTFVYTTAFYTIVETLFKLFPSFLELNLIIIIQFCRESVHVHTSYI